MTSVTAEEIDALKAALRQELSTTFRVAVPVSDETALFSGGLIDSLSVMELVSFVERKLGRPIEPTDITLDNFDSVARIAQFARKTAPAG